MTFVERLPKFCGPDGFPLSWRHYVYGMSYLSRAHAREQLHQAQAHRLSRVDREDWDIFQRDTMRMTEVPRGR